MLVLPAINAMLVTNGGGVNSDRTYIFEPNPLTLRTVTLDFTAPGDPTLRLTFTDGQPARESTIGLDGIFRMSPGGLGMPIGVRGYWQDDSTFALDYDQIATIDPFVPQLHNFTNLTHPREKRDL